MRKRLPRPRRRIRRLHIRTRRNQPLRCHPRVLHAARQIRRNVNRNVRPCSSVGLVVDLHIEQRELRRVLSTAATGGRGFVPEAVHGELARGGVPARSRDRGPVRLAPGKDVGDLERARGADGVGDEEVCGVGGVDLRGAVVVREGEPKRPWFRRLEGLESGRWRTRDCRELRSMCRVRPVFLGGRKCYS